MSSPQAGIFVEGSAHHYLLEYSLDERASAGSVRDALGGVRVLESDEVARVLAFGARAWKRMAPDIAVPELRPFDEIKGDGFSAPSTQRDLLFWLHGAGRDALLDQALAIHAALAPLATLELDQPGFVYRDSRDLTGFIDGTANATGDARFEVACVPEARTGAGGSFVLSQRWIHDLPRFRSLPVEEQERVIGRTKPDSVELEGDAMPPDSHVSRTDLKVDGVAQKLYRRSFPYGTVREHGLCFLAFTCELSRFDVLLRSMFGASGDGIRDRLIEFSRPVTGSYWFAPAEEDLAEIL